MRIIREWNDVVNVVAPIVGSRPRALAALEGMKLQAYYDASFAGFRFLGKRGGISTKAVQRMMGQLVEAGLIKRTRLVRLDKTQGTYRVDWSALWSRVVEGLRALNRRRQMAEARDVKKREASYEEWQAWKAEEAAAGREVVALGPAPPG